MKKRIRIFTAFITAFICLFACVGFLACDDARPTPTPTPDDGVELTFVPAQKEDCGNDGHTAYYTDGSKFYADADGESELSWENDILIPATGNHTESEEWQSENGKHYHNCEVCGKKVPSTEADHVFTWVTDEYPTEDSAGSKHEECVCGETRNENTEIPSLSTIIHHEYKEADCGNDGNEEYWEKGGLYYSDENCTEPFDGEVTIPATGQHTAEEEWQSENGKHYHNCEVCGKKVPSTEADHVFTWVTDTAATDDTPGSKHEECECGETRNENTEIPALGVIIHHEHKDPTCEEDGNEEYWEKGGLYYSDAECTEPFEGEVTIPATGHSYGEPEWTWTKGDDGSYTATVMFTCSECDGELGPITAENVRYEIDENGDKVYKTDAVELDDEEYVGHYKVTLEGITLAISGVQQNFYEDTEFNYDNLVVTALYSDGTDGEVIPDDVSTPDMTGSGDREVTVTYKSVAQTYTIHIISAGVYDGDDLTMQAAETVVKDCHSQSTDSFDFVGGISVGSTLTFMFESTVDDKVSLRIYGNGNGVGRFDVAIETDGEQIESGAVTLNTGSYDWWNKWEVGFFVCYLDVEQGKTYTVVFTAAGEGIEANINYIKVVPANGYNGTDGLILKGDSAEMLGCDYQPNTEDGIIGNIGEGSSFSFTFVSAYEGELPFIVMLAGGIRNGFWSPVNKAIIHIIVNGQEIVEGGQQVQSRGLTNYDTFTYTIELEAGVNVIEFKVIAGDVTINHAAGEEAVFFNFSRVVFPKAYLGEEIKLGAKEAALSGSGNLQNGFSTYDGSLIGGTGTDTVLSFVVLSEQEEEAKLYVSVDGEDGKTVSFEVYVNGESVGLCSAGASGWLNFNEIFESGITLTEGENTIEIHSVSGAFNFNYLRLAPVAA